MVARFSDWIFTTSHGGYNIFHLQARKKFTAHAAQREYTMPSDKRGIYVYKSDTTIFEQVHPDRVTLISLIDKLVFCTEMVLGTIVFQENSFSPVLYILYVALWLPRPTSRVKKRMLNYLNVGAFYGKPSQLYSLPQGGTAYLWLFRTFWTKQCSYIRFNVPTPCCPQ